VKGTSSNFAKLLGILIAFQQQIDKLSTIQSQIHQLFTLSSLVLNTGCHGGVSHGVFDPGSSITSDFESKTRGREIASIHTKVVGGAQRSRSTVKSRLSLARNAVKHLRLLHSAIECPSVVGKGVEKIST
jgi:hypothetical protein